MNRLDDLWNDSGSDTERLMFFSDAVFAIALTLLVIDLRVPGRADSLTLPSSLLAMWPQLVSLLISFFVISFYWRAHHLIFRLIARYDQRLVGLNFVFLLGIVLQPFTTSLLCAYGAQPIAIMLYAGLLAASGLLLTSMWVYASADRRLIEAPIDAHLVRFFTLRTLVPALIFLASIGLTVVLDSTVVPWVWLLILPVRGILRWWLKRSREISVSRPVSTSTGPPLVPARALPVPPAKKRSYDREITLTRTSQTVAATRKKR